MCGRAGPRGRPEVLVHIAGVTRRGALVAGDLAGAAGLDGGDDDLTGVVAGQTTSPRSRDGTEYSPPSKAITGVLAPTVRATPKTAV